MSRRRTASHIFFVAAYLALMGAVGAQDNPSVVDTKHNLSASGPGPVKVAGTQGVCIFCHTPHSASPAAPLWKQIAKAAAIVAGMSGLPLAGIGAHSLLSTPEPPPASAVESPAVVTPEYLIEVEKASEADPFSP